MDVDIRPHIAAYRHKRDLVVNGLKDCYELVAPGGAFYAFPNVKGLMAACGFATSQEVADELFEVDGVGRLAILALWTTWPS